MALSLLKGLAPFAPLTSAEAAVFEAQIDKRGFSSGERVLADDAVLVVGEGFIGLSVEVSGGSRGFAVAGAGDLLGELALFEPSPIPIDAKAETKALCYALDRRALRRCFQYTRTGAARFMMISARGLSRKLRSADELLNRGLAQNSASRGVSLSESPAQPVPLGALDRERLKALSMSRHFPEGALVFGEGTPGTELFIIEQGEVEILKGTASGKPLSIARLGPGDFFGEMAFVDRGPRSASAVARTAVELGILPADALERIVELNVGTALFLANVICKILARRLNATLKRIRSLAAA